MQIGATRTNQVANLLFQVTLEWSYRLLTPQEQVLFHRLSAFQGSAPFQLEVNTGRARLSTQTQPALASASGG